MADEALFLLLHNEMVSGVYKSAEQGEVENGRCITKLENMGFRVGQGLIERFTKDTARFKDELDIMKFICKDFWTTVFKKQIDNLRTNHQLDVLASAYNPRTWEGHLCTSGQQISSAYSDVCRKTVFRTCI
ncbi:trafficking protein particle complex subunit 6B isoform X8 [Castor canadensis]|uniref:Trafficking protein particle complex subunit 6B isoform X8 n=1 Tax=Castor canadensis TaxID=51338 RepID=A0AC58M481_CASCN